MRRLSWWQVIASDPMQHAHIIAMYLEGFDIEIQRRTQGLPAAPPPLNADGTISDAAHSSHQSG